MLNEHWLTDRRRNPSAVVLCGDRDQTRGARRRESFGFFLRLETSVGAATGEGGQGDDESLSRLSKEAEGFLCFCLLATLDSATDSLHSSTGYRQIVSKDPIP